ncbi:MAG: PEGA domain-containing protein, partial [Phycisphaeraceae bacterium]|nr:PEGA domain-containing protein [Phycisphaeraceae bacterium]
MNTRNADIPRSISMMLVGAMFVFGAGCVRRVVQITSDPDGAVVWMNDREVGSTPCEVEILHYGKYDVRVEKPGWEPVMTGRSANAPVWDLPGPDFFAELVPAEIESRNVWHFQLVVESDDADEVLLRAEAARDKVAAERAEAQADAPDATSRGLAEEVEAEDGTGTPGAAVEGAPAPVGVADPGLPQAADPGLEPGAD